MQKEYTIGIVGLGYVGLPLAVEFSKKFKTIGFDINFSRVEEIKSGIDVTNEVEDKTLKFLKSSKNFSVTSDPDLIKDCNVYIITVPTPTDKIHRPVLRPLLEASKTVAKYIKKEDIIIYESTVYPGVTEDECVPLVEKISGLKFNSDFFAGYSPERINPGDKVRTITKIKKITSGSNKKTSEEVNFLYSQIIEAGTYMAESIKVAEAAKVIENCQRDINIAFINELAKIFNLLDIDTTQVLKAAGTKWNFLPFKPGLVGGHCIGIDPYYLAQKAQEVGYHPEIILSGRRLNDSMGEYVANEVIKYMVKESIKINDSKILVLGISFKENCPDVRNTKVIDIITTLEKYGVNVDVFDPVASSAQVKTEFDINMLESINDKYDSIVLAVAHEDFKNLDLNNFLRKNHVIYDIKSFLNIPGTIRL
jgi:UDP-N-acetyl-D-galactosamine dehydrogenase